MITFEVAYPGKPHLTLVPPSALAYDSLLVTVATLLQIPSGEEVFLYVIPGDFTDHVRVCPRLLSGLYDSVTKQGISAKLHIRVFTPNSFLFEKTPVAQTGGQAQNSTITTPTSIVTSTVY